VTDYKEVTAYKVRKDWLETQVYREMLAFRESKAKSGYRVFKVKELKLIGG
jgi:hypothetical protein